MIDWNSIKLTDGLTDLYEGEINEAKTAVTLNGYTVPLRDTGINVEWWENNNLTKDKLKNMIPENIRDYINLGTIHLDKGGLLSHVFENHNVNNMIREEIVDWLRERDIEVPSMNIQSNPSVDMITEDISEETQEKKNINI